MADLFCPVCGIANELKNRDQLCTSCGFGPWPGLDGHPYFVAHPDDGKKRTIDQVLRQVLGGRAAHFGTWPTGEVLEVVGGELQRNGVAWAPTNAEIVEDKWEVVGFSMPPQNDKTKRTLDQALVQVRNGKQARFGTWLESDRLTFVSTGGGAFLKNGASWVPTAAELTVRGWQVFNGSARAE